MQHSPGCGSVTNTNEDALACILTSGEKVEISIPMASGLRDLLRLTAERKDKREEQEQ